MKNFFKKLFIFILFSGFTVGIGLISKEYFTSKIDQNSVVKSTTSIEERMYYCGDCGFETTNKTTYCKNCGVEASWYVEKPEIKEKRKGYCELDGCDDIRVHGHEGGVVQGQKVFPLANRRIQEDEDIVLCNIRSDEYHIHNEDWNYFQIHTPTLMYKTIEQCHEILKNDMFIGKFYINNIVDQRSDASKDGRVSYQSIDERTIFIEDQNEFPIPIDITISN